MKLSCCIIAVIILVAQIHAASAPTNSAVGAQTSFVTYEAEAPGNHVTGKIVRMTSPPSATESSPELESSGRAYAELKKPNDSLDIRVTNPANTLVVRHCIPDAVGGGGMTQGQRRVA
jgi:hypothetical protein